MTDLIEDSLAHCFNSHVSPPTCLVCKLRDEIERLTAERDAAQTNWSNEVLELTKENERLRGAIECRDATIKGQVVAMRQAADEIERLRAALEAAPEPIRNEYNPGWLDQPRREAYVYWYVNTRREALQDKDNDL